MTYQPGTTVLQTPSASRTYVFMDTYKPKMLSSGAVRILILILVISVGAFFSVNYVQDHFYVHIEELIDSRINWSQQVMKANMMASGSGPFPVQEAENTGELQSWRDVYKAQSGPRKSYIANMYNNHKNNIDKRKGIGLLYNVLAPEAYCSLKVRVGNIEDGGKWVCNPWRLPKSGCQVYSLGINQEISFDVHLQTLSNKTCRLYAYDMSPQPATIISQLQAINGQFKVAKLGDTTNAATKQYKIGDLMKENNDTSIEILKIDIEGSEFSVMPQIFQATKVCQILIEMHKPLVETIDLLRAFSKAGFYLFSYETNGYDYKVSEYSFIHKDCMQRYDVVLLAQYLQKKRR